MPTSMPCAGSQLGMRYRSYPQGTPSTPEKTKANKEEGEELVGQAHRLSLHEQGSNLLKNEPGLKKKCLTFTDICQGLCDRFRNFPESQFIVIRTKFPDALQFHPVVLYLRIFKNETMQGDNFKSHPAPFLPSFVISSPSFRKILFAPSTIRFSLTAKWSHSAHGWALDQAEPTRAPHTHMHTQAHTLPRPH